MTVRLGVQPLKTPRLDVISLDGRVRHEMEFVAREMKDRLNTTTSTWKGPKPVFNVWMPKEKDRMQLTVYPAGNALGVKKWRWLDEGTSVRHAVMSRDWISKTHPVGSKLGSFQSFGGRGKMMFVSRKIHRPGIKARGWSVALARAYAPTFGDRINNAVRAWANYNAWQNW